MPVILVANSKGGVGKSTIAANLAGFYAGRGERTMLGDLDRQQSAHGWLSRRPSAAPAIKSWDVCKQGIGRMPRDVTHVVLDSPSGLHGTQLKDAVKLASKIIVPLQPSALDIHATHDFLARLAEHGARPDDGRVALVGTRVDPRTRSASEFERYVQKSGFPCLGFLRDTQNYIQLAAHGLTLWDVAQHRVEQDIAQWTPIIHWISGGRRAV